jgi:hypothetical protein
MLTEEDSPPPGPARDPELLAWSRWHLRRRRRWPLVLLVIASLAFGIYMALVGRGERWIAARLPSYEAAAAAARPAPLPSAENAAPLWREAFSLARRWDPAEDPEDGAEDEDEPPADPLDRLEDPGALGVPDLLAEDGHLARHVARNAAALEAARRAVLLPGCDWGEPPLDIFAASDAEEEAGGQASRLKLTRDLARVAARSLLHLGARGRWSEAAELWRVIESLSRHTALGGGLVDALVASGLRQLADETLLQALAVSPGPPPEAVLEDLAAAARERLGTLPRIAEALERDAREMEWSLARLLAGPRIELDPRTWNGAREMEIPLVFRHMTAVSELCLRRFAQLREAIVEHAREVDAGGVPRREDIEDLVRPRSPWSVLSLPASFWAGGVLGVPDMHADGIARVRSFHVVLAALGKRLETGTWPGRIEEAAGGPAGARDPWLREGLLSYTVEGDAILVGSVGERGILPAPQAAERMRERAELRSRAVRFMIPAAWQEREEKKEGTP